MQKSGIYEIVSPSGKRYIGSSVNIAKRWARHRQDLRRNMHHCAALQRAFVKYGEDALTFNVLEYCEPLRLVEREQMHMDVNHRTALYNSAPRAGSCLGVRRTVESRTKQSNAQAGRYLSAETIAKISAAAKARNTSTMVREACVGNAAAQRGRPTHRNTSGYPGVYFDTYGRNWRGRVTINGKKKSAGRAATAEEAYRLLQSFIAENT